MTENSAAAVAAQITKAEKAAIFCHVRPDGDALGSGLALLLALRAAGKTAYFVCEELPPEKFYFLSEMKHTLLSYLCQRIAVISPLDIFPGYV